MNRRNLSRIRIPLHGARAAARAPDRTLTRRGWLFVLGGYMLAMIAFGIALDPSPGLLRGWLRILTSPGMLVSDYVEIGGPGAAFCNAGLVGLAGLLLAAWQGMSLSGPIVAAVFTMAGFGLFGKNVWSIWPIIAGVALFSRVARRPFKGYILVALFGTALSPLVTQVAFGLGLPLWAGLALSLLLGVGVGTILPPLAVYMLRLHQGYNIYNVGLTCGFLGLFITALLNSVGLPTDLPFHWDEAHSQILGAATLVCVLSMVGLGLYLTRSSSGLRRL